MKQTICYGSEDFQKVALENGRHSEGRTDQQLNFNSCQRINCQNSLNLFLSVSQSFFFHYLRFQLFF